MTFKSPARLISTPRPRLAPTPNKGPNTGASQPPADMAGLKTLSAKVAATRGEMTTDDKPIERRTANTRPCTSGATFACQMVWLQAEIIGRQNKKLKPDMANAATELPSPMAVRKSEP